MTRRDGWTPPWAPGPIEPCCVCETRVMARTLAEGRCAACVAGDRQPAPEKLQTTLFEA